MSINDFMNTLSEEQKNMLLKALLNDSPELSTSSRSELAPQTNQITTPQSASATVGDDFTMKRQENNSNLRRKEPVRARKNDWTDTGEFRDIETPKGDRAPRKRPPHKKVEVECHVCGKTFKEDPRYIHGEYYRCNRCTGR